MARYSEHEIDEAVERDQLARAAARDRDRAAHPEQWQLVEDEWSSLFGPTWVQVQDSGVD